jgi:hypothetical protein
MASNISSYDIILDISCSQKKIRLFTMRIFVINLIQKIRVTSEY